MNIYVHVKMSPMYMGLMVTEHKSVYNLCDKGDAVDLN